MKKLLLLSACIVLLAGCKSASSPSASPAPTSEPVSQNGGDFAAVASAINAGQSVSCTIAKKDGSTTMSYLMHGKKMKITGMQVEGKTQSGAMVSDGEYFYSWDEQTKQGIKMKMPTEQDLKDIAAKNGQTVPSLESEEDKKRFEEQGYDVKCAVQVVDDSTFTVPSDVKLTDMSGLMKQTTNMLKQSSGSANPQSIEEMKKQAQEMMKQYQQ